MQVMHISSCNKPSYDTVVCGAWLQIVGSSFGTLQITAREWVCANEAIFCLSLTHFTKMRTASIKKTIYMTSYPLKTFELLSKDN